MALIDDVKLVMGLTNTDDADGNITYAGTVTAEEFVGDIDAANITGVLNGSQINSSQGNDVGKIVERDTSDGGFAAGTVQLINLILSGGMRNAVVAIAAAGDGSQASGATLTGGNFYNVTGGNGGNTSVKLLTANGSGNVIVHNNSASQLLLYPLLGQTISGRGVNGGVVLNPYETITLYPVSSTTWVCSKPIGTNGGAGWTTVEGTFGLTVVNGVVTSFTYPD